MILSIIWCFFRCCLCGYRCCTCCCGGCGGRRERSDGGSERTTTLIVEQPPYSEPPRYAYYDSANDDALPIMPSLEKTQCIAVSVSEEHELAFMRPAIIEDVSLRHRYGDGESSQGLRYINNSLQHPSPIRQYWPDASGSQAPQYRYKASFIPPIQETGYEKETIEYHQNPGRNQKISGNLSEPSLNRGGERKNGRNDYQDLVDHHLDISSYQSQRSQQEWTNV